MNKNFLRALFLMFSSLYEMNTMEQPGLKEEKGNIETLLEAEIRQEELSLKTKIEENKDEIEEQKKEEERQHCELLKKKLAKLIAARDVLKDSTLSQQFKDTEKKKLQGYLKEKYRDSSFAPWITVHYHTLEESIRLYSKEFFEKCS